MVLLLSVCSAAADYVVTNITGRPFTIAFTEGVAKLYAYYLGRNEDGVR